MIDAIREGLAGLILLSNVAVWVGVYFEQEKFSKTKQELGWRILLVGLAAEAAFSIFMFAADEKQSWSQRTEIATLQGRATAAEGKISEAQRDVAQANGRAAEANAKAAEANTRAAEANTKAANLLAENVELERALAPRIIDQGVIANAISGLARVPVLIVSMDEEEPRQVARQIEFAFNGMRIGNTSPWYVTSLPPSDWASTGIIVQYVRAAISTDPGSGDSEQLARTFCKLIEDQGYSISLSRVSPNASIFRMVWPETIPFNAIIIGVGRKPNNFWMNKMLRDKGLPPYRERSLCT